MSAGIGVPMESPYADEELRQRLAELGYAGLNTGRLLATIAARDAEIARLERIEEQAHWVVDEAYRTEDGQAFVVDPMHWRDLRDALSTPAVDSPESKARPEPDGTWIGPCAHGSDPYDRCDTCGALTTHEARSLAYAALVVDSPGDEGRVPGWSGIVPGDEYKPATPAPTSEAQEIAAAHEALIKRWHPSAPKPEPRGEAIGKEDVDWVRKDKFDRVWEDRSEAYRIATVWHNKYDRRTDDYARACDERDTARARVGVLEEALRLWLEHEKTYDPDNFDANALAFIIGNTQALLGGGQ